jgi:hypothetical protein
MTTSKDSSTRSLAFIEHLVRFPEDLRDIRRLQRQFRLTAAEAARALEAWHRGVLAAPRRPELSH